MPIVKEKNTGKVISRQLYNKEGTNTAAQIADSNPNWELTYDTNDARSRSEMTYMGGGKVHEYKKGGKVESKKILDEMINPPKRKSKPSKDKRVRDYEHRFLTEQEKIEKGWKMKKTKIYRKKKSKK